MPKFVKSSQCALSNVMMACGKGWFCQPEDVDVRIRLHRRFCRLCDESVEVRNRQPDLTSLDVPKEVTMNRKQRILKRISR